MRDQNKSRAKGNKKMKNSVLRLIILAGIFGFSSARASVEKILKDTHTWTDENGKSLELSQFKDHPLVMTMIYTNCRKTCPNLTLAKLKELQAELNQRNQKAEFIIVTLDPDQDTPEVMANFKKHMKLDFGNWHFLRASQDQTRHFAREIKMENYWTMDDHIVHDFRIVYFDPAQAGERFLDSSNKNVKKLFE